MKKFLALFLIMFMMPAFASEFDKAYSTGKNMLVYFYSSSCISCKKFNPIYDEIKKSYKDMEFVKVNVETPEGVKMFRKYHGYYIPYLILTNSKTKNTVSISLSCGMNDMCFERVIKDYR